MKSRQAVQVRRRLRFCFGWMLILSLAAVELWVMGNFVADFSPANVTSQWEVVPPLVETFLADR
jgi:hypothetical protein